MAAIALNMQKFQYRRAYSHVEQLLRMQGRGQTADGHDISDLAQIGTGTVCAVASWGSPEEPAFYANPSAEIYAAIDAMHRSAVTLLLRQPCWKTSRPPKAYMSIYPAWCKLTEATRYDKGLQKELKELFAAGNGLCGHPSSDKPLSVNSDGFLVPMGQNSSETFVVGVTAVMRYFSALTKLWREVLVANGKNPDEHPEQYEHLVDIG